MSARSGDTAPASGVKGADPITHFVAPAKKPIRWLISDDPHAKEAFYALILPLIRKAAKRLGYGVGVHGSQKRDLDVIAVPWRDHWEHPDQLAEAIQKAVCGSARDQSPSLSAGGRLSYVIHIGRTAYIDLSVTIPAVDEERA